MLLALALGVAPASAQPPPDNVDDAAAQLEQVQRDAEALTEQWHAATDDLAARQGELDALRSAVEPARIALEQARAAEEEFRLQIDALALATFESGNLDQFNALLASGDPQDFLDQMSALELLASDHRAALDQLLIRVDDTAAAQQEADAAVSRAQAAADAAAAAAADLDARKREAEVRIEAAERLLAQLSPRQRADRLGSGVDGPAGPITGTGVGVVALRAAQTQLGKPYRWGASGPGSFDCSGLTSWAFREAGVTLPRSSRQQARIGQPVAWDDLQPGDLVFSYNPISHVGIYAGDGVMINSPQTGDVVKYSEVSSRNFTAARRL